MNVIAENLLIKMQRGYGKFFKTPRQEIRLNTDYQGQEASHLIKDMISQAKPCMISRFGTIENEAILRHLAIIDDHHDLLKVVRFIKDKTDPFWWDGELKSNMLNHAGFFPVNEKFLSRFADRNLKDIKNIDVLACRLTEPNFLKNEVKLLKFCSNPKIIPIDDLDPFHHNPPWSQALEDQKVLVIHPFEESILHQYSQRESLFKNPKILPKFDLKTLKAVQSIAGNQVEFSSWFEALEFMCDRVAQIDFDIALIGAGAYGLPLASFVKNLNKKAVHLGGSTQILFGIKGKRWDDIPFYRQLYNENWIRPLVTNVVDNGEIVEGGCYW